MGQGDGCEQCTDIREEPAGAGHSFSYLALQEAALELVSSGEW